MDAGGGERQWTQAHCPNCGEPDVDYISQREFARRAGIKAETVGRRIKSGRYCCDASKKVPWCLICTKKTPEGRGVKRRGPDPEREPGEQAEPPAEEAVPPIDGGPLSKSDREQICSWCAQVVSSRFGLPRPSLGSYPGSDSSNETQAYELMNEGAVAVFDAAKRRGEMLSRDEVEQIAYGAMKRFRNEDVKSRLHESQGRIEDPEEYGSTGRKPKGRDMRRRQDERSE
jgi:hypothetical protein